MFSSDNNPEMSFIEEKENKINDSFLEIQGKEIEYEEVEYKKKSKNAKKDKEEKQEDNELVIKFNNDRKIKERIYSDLDNKICLNLFNPQDHTSYNFIRNNWLNVKAYFFKIF